MWWQLLRVGRAARRGAEGNRLRFAALLLATLALALSATAITAGWAVHDGREQRGSARAPQYVDPDGGDAPVLVRPAYDTVDGLQKSVVYVEPKAADAAPPPGVSAWPERGEALLSPALRRDLEKEGAEDRYGTPAGAIAAEGLEVPDERLAYVRPRHGVMSSGEWLAASGFGGPERANFGDSDFVRPDSWFLMCAAGLLVLPALVLTVIAARSGSAGRDRRVALLRALGAGSRARALVSLGEAVAPVALGAAVAGAVTLAALRTDVRLPVVDFLLPAADLRRWAGALVGTVLGSALVVLAAVLSLHRAAPAESSTRPGAGRRFRAGRVAWLCPVFLVVAVYGSDVAAQGGGGDWLPVYVLGTVGTLATVPAVIAVLVRWLGQRLVRLGNRRGLSGALVAGRWASASPGVITRLVATVVISIGLVSQVQLHMSRLGDPVREAQAVYQRIGDSALKTGIPDRPAQVGAFIRALPPDVHALAVTSGFEGARLTGRCSALRELKVSCRDAKVRISDPRLQELVAMSPGGAERVTLHKGAPEAAKDADELFLVREGGGDLPVSAIKRTAFRHLPHPEVDPIGMGWVAGAGWDLQATAWVRALGGIGIGLLALASVLNNLGDFLRLGRRLAPLSVLVGERRIFYATAAWAVLAPLVLAALVGTAAAVWLGTPLELKAGAELPTSFVLAVLAGALALAVASWWWGARTAARAAGRWRPTGE